jgi:hypothetical protein
MATVPDLDQQIHDRAAELLGGEAEYQRLADEESREVRRRWQQNTDTMGRILRAHLFIERFMTDNLQRSNPALGSLEKAKLTFAQKVALLNPNDPDIAEVTPGLRRMNGIRNRLAHESHAEVTAEDAAVLLACKTFAQMLRMRETEKFTLLTPVEILENFAKHASIALTARHSRLIDAVAKATRELAPGE